MSDENAPRLRLKPKLAADPATAPQQPAATSAPAPELPPALAPPLPAPNIEEPAVKLGLQPTGAAAPVSTPPAEPLPADPNAALAPAAATEPPRPEDPVGADRGAGGESPEIAAIHKASGSLFPPPSGKFPPPPELARNLAVAERMAKAGEDFGGAYSGSRKRLLIITGGALAVALVLGGGFFVDLKFTAEPPPPPPKSKLGAQPAKAPEPAAVEPAKEFAVAPKTEAPKAEPVEVVPAATKTQEPAAPVVPPPPPVASNAFKAWVENLKISGVRSGSRPRVFIGGTSYAPGDLVNPQLGITFAGYNPESRRLIFKDANGAEVERRN